jgi:hypothetical protein
MATIGRVTFVPNNPGSHIASDVMPEHTSGHFVISPAGKTAIGVTGRCARRSWRDPTGESPVRVRHSEPPGNECCGRCGNAGSEAYTVIAWGVGLSHEMTTLWRPRPSSEPKATCVAPPSRGAIAPPGSEATSRAKGSCRNLGDPVASAGMVTGGGSQRGITGADCTAAGSRTGP